jgi:hypothetical protein
MQLSAIARSTAAIARKAAIARSTAAIARAALFT